MKRAFAPTFRFRIRPDTDEPFKRGLFVWPVRSRSLALYLARARACSARFVSRPSRPPRLSLKVRWISSCCASGSASTRASRISHSLFSKCSYLRSPGLTLPDSPLRWTPFNPCQTCRAAQAQSRTPNGPLIVPAFRCLAEKPTVWVSDHAVFD
jgi:hypothetical protein